jgi:hypothetical protein
MATAPDNRMRWVRLGGIGFVLVVGWLFIGWHNRFHITPPLVFVGLGYLAVVLTTYNLWRTGAAAVAPNDEDDGDASWGKPTGALGELDREKRTMLKAIKEAEFDHAMGKLSKVDAEQMIGMYRARAIEVMKEIEQIELGAAGTVRERIMREVKARVALDGKLAKDKKAGRTAIDDDVAYDAAATCASAPAPEPAPSVADAEDMKRAEAAAAPPPPDDAKETTDVSQEASS